MARHDDAHPALDPDPLWYKNAVIYELHVRAFQDSDGDGIGDFKGLTRRLDYLQDLGVNTLWLLPFYPSPLRDDGYDIADYTDVHPSYGTLRDFKRFVKEAHRRGMRVITELVINHTSDQHPLFQKARRSPPGSRARDYYVWSDTPERYRGTRIIFKDFEQSNWTWDPVAKAYYWHRFYSHQPDLNFENPLVHKLIFKWMDFWLKLGVDGLRLDAIPYLYEREGTSCENLPETHGYLKKLRTYVDEHYEGRMLLAEANQWPEDAIAYFGDGDECHMAFHFPVMPRMFMAIHMEDRFPLIDIMQQTPPIPEGCQWAIFLRNHDELTLEMVTDEERDYMYRVYANDRRARINLGIRRRLAPLLGNNRRKIELMNGLLFSLPGTPVLYYGDEIGMGDNIYLGDRDGVRTPMQWSADQNAGFSRANPQKLYLPVNIDPIYRYEAVNVEAQYDNPHALLWWMKRLINLREHTRVFGHGSLEFLFPENPKVLVYIRELEDERVLVVANLSRFVQYAELDLSKWKGLVPVELFGRTRFPPIGDLPYFLTLAPHGFYWLSLEPMREEIPVHLRGPGDEIPTVTVTGHWETLLRGRTKRAFERVIPRALESRRWYGGKARTAQAASIVDVVPVGAAGRRPKAWLLFVQITYTEGEPEMYVVPVAHAAGAEAETLLQEKVGAVLVKIETRGKSETALLYDAFYEESFPPLLLDTIERRRRLKGDKGEIGGMVTRAYRDVVDPDASLAPHVARAEQSNTSLIYGEQLILKLYRRLTEGQNPDLEVGRFLTRAGFAHIPQVAGAIEYQVGKEEPRTLAILQSFVPNEGDAWRYTLDALGAYYEEVLAHRHGEPSQEPEAPRAALFDLLGEVPPAELQNRIGPYLASAQLLGQRTGELHRALASHPDEPDFAPEPFTAHYQRGLLQSVRTQLKQATTLLRTRMAGMPADLAEEAQALLDGEAAATERLQGLTSRPIEASRIRVHGDYHLGQVLFTGRDFVIIDFEGEPARPLSERRLKRSPLRDVAGMLRSFHYAAYAALFDQASRWGADSNPDVETHLRAGALAWYRWVSATFLGAYLDAVRGAGLLPKTRADVETLLAAELIEKASYELSYELNNRPSWIRIPIQGLRELLDGSADGAS
jgi:maltose alpha-D-glucosyltransferase / alpha-amylase